DSDFPGWVAHAWPVSSKGEAGFVLTWMQGMGVQQFVKAALKSSLSTFDAESITIGASTIKAVIDDIESNTQSGVGAKHSERTLVVTFPADAISTIPKSGDSVTARGMTWQIHSEPGSVR